MTDIDMPGSVNGLNMAETLRNRWPPIEIIVASGKQRHTVDGQRSRAVFEQKPYNSAGSSRDQVISIRFDCLDDSPGVDA
ncbi:hypothetical protein [Rhizobium sp. OAE497]|uniref:hypothetical protein n=1 Tax=Rhizobium sp. OAE497 TaxID=2663796 RepID=UPI0018F5C23B